METPFHEISAIGSVQGVFLLSEQGEVLFESDNGWLSAEDRFVLMRRTVKVLPSVKKAVFLFGNGVLHVVKTGLGYLLVSRENTVLDMQFANICKDLQGKLEEPDKRKKMLLHLLAQSRPVLKPQIVKALVPYGDADVAQELVRLLKAERSFSPEVRDRLLLHVCQSLGYHPFEYVLGALREFLDKTESVHDTVLRAARAAVKQIEMDGTQKEDTPAASSKSSPQETQKENDPPITGLPEELRVHEYLAKGQKQKGAQLLREMITETAHKQRFKEAEKLRQWLIRIDPMALPDIIAAAEIIESEKTAAINKDHLAVWSSLREILDPEAFSTLYHSLEHLHYASGEAIVRQGAQQSSLYFVNSGRVELFFHEKGKDIKVKTIGPGEILGSGTFFEASVWTLSARSLGADLSRLKMDAMQQWQGEYPALEGKLMDFCIKFKIPLDAFAKTGRDRREHTRYSTEGRVAMALLDKDEQGTGIGAKGDLFDISAGGAAFSLRISQKKNARLLFGRKVRLTISSPASRDLTATGEIIAVRSQPVVGNEFSVHVRFTQLLSESAIQAFLSA